MVQEHEPAVPGICAAQQDMWGLVENGEEGEKERKENEGRETEERQGISARDTIGSSTSTHETACLQQ